MSTKKAPKIAIVHDWLTNMGGAERVVLAMHEAFPKAPIYTSTYEPENVPLFDGLDIRTTWLQKMPRPLRRLHKFLPTLRVKAFRDLDLSEYDIIVSSSSAEAKQVVKSGENQIHICYCHTPIRYYWSHYDEYRKDPGFGKLNWLVRLAMPAIVPRMKKADYEAAQTVDIFVANSREVQKRIKQYYGRPSIVVHPPVDSERFHPKKDRKNYYVALGRQVPYKRIDLAVEAATKLNLPLKVFGNGSEHHRLLTMAGDTVSFYTDRFDDASDEAVATALSEARGFIFPTEEDFGIVQVEALAAGAPVIAYGKGGTLDIVEDGETGILFGDQTVVSLMNALEQAEKITFDPAKLARVAKRFHRTLFVNKLRKIVIDQLR